MVSRYVVARYCAFLIIVAAAYFLNVSLNNQLEVLIILH